jgi:hypothetical protein
MSKTLCAAAAATLLLTTMRISAHHAFAAGYYENKRSNGPIRTPGYTLTERMKAAR